MASNWSHGRQGWQDPGQPPPEQSREVPAPEPENPLDPHRVAEATEREPRSAAIPAPSGPESKTDDRAEAAPGDQSDDLNLGAPGGALDLPDFGTPRLAGRGRGPIPARPEAVRAPNSTPEQRLLILD